MTGAGNRDENTLDLSLAFNVDVKLTDTSDPSQVQFVNMTARPAAGALQVRGTWRGAPIFVPSDGGEFDWDGRPGQEVAFVFDGPSAGSRLVLGLQSFTNGHGALPGRGSSGNGFVIDPNDPAFRVQVTWLIT